MRGVTTARSYRLRSASTSAVLASVFSSFILMTRAGQPATNNSASRHVLGYDRAGSHNCTLANAASLDDHGVCAEKHVVLDHHGRRTRGLHHASKHAASAHVAVGANRGAPTQNSAHVNHGAHADDRTDVDDRAHHDNRVVANLHLIADDGARLDASVHVAHVEQRNAGVAAVVLYDDIESQRRGSRDQSQRAHREQA